MRTSPGLALLAAACVLGASTLSAGGEPAGASTLRAVADRIGTSYVEPSRVDPQKMLWAAARALDREVPEVVLEPGEDQSALTLRVSGERATFPLVGVRSLGALTRSLEDILRFVDAHRDPSSKPNAEYAAINGLLATLDPHSVLIDPAEAKEFATLLASRLYGIGIVFDSTGSRATGASPGVPVVVNVIKGGPAEAAGVALCNRILAVEDRWVAGLDWQELAGLIRGPAGSPVWVTLLRDGTVKDLVMTRAEVKLSLVDGRRLDGNVGLIQIQGFARGTAEDVRAAIEELRKAGATSWILDLRTNSGGLLRQAIETASLFIRSGPIVTTISGAGREREVEVAKRPSPDFLEEGPLVVLIGPSTVSAAEVLAAALQNRNRAALLGRTSWGKGSVQVVYDEMDGSKLKLTVAHYVTPGGASLQSRGITPDIELVPVPVPLSDRVRLSAPEPAGREADLERAFTPREAVHRSGVSLRYLAATPDAEEEVRFARDLLVATRARARGDALERKAFLDARRDLEEAKVAAALSSAGVDWSSGPAGSAAKLDIRCAQGTPSKDDRVPFTCDVRNDGPQDAFRIIGRARPLAFDLKDEEIVVGRVPAGSTRKVTLDGRLAEDPSPRVSWVTFAFSDQSEGAVRDVPLRIEATARARPAAGGAPRRVEIRVEAGPPETTDGARTVKASIRAPGVRDAWVRISNLGQKLDRKKVAYVARPIDSAGAALDFAADVPLRRGLNEIGVCSRAGSEERCETAFVYRLAATATP